MSDHKKTEVHQDHPVPPAIRGEAFSGWQVVFDDIRASNRSKNMLIGGLGFVVFILVVTVYQMMPLKERVPYFVEVEEATGRVAPSNRYGQSFKPGENNLRYFVNRWVIDVLSVDAKLSTGGYLPEAMRMTSGEGSNQLRRFVEKEEIIDRIVKNPNIAVRAKVSTITFLQEGIVMVRAVQIDGTQEQRKLITMRYILVTPQTDEDILYNPIGFFVTDFTINDELA